MVRWRMAVLLALAIAINYLDRLTLPSVIDQMPKSMAFDKQSFALLNTAFLAAYGAMYLVGGKLLDRLGTRRGFTIIILFWSLACASHGLATGLVSLVVCRLLLGLGEGGGFPGATRAVAEWFPVKERSIAMGIMNGATGVGGMVALPLLALLLYHTGWLGLEPWRWVFFITGSFGLVWLLWWLADYQVPEKHRGVSAAEREHIRGGIPAATLAEPKVPLAELFAHRETWGIVVAKFLTDAAWYFILFWMPKYLNGLHSASEKYDFGKTASVAWIPQAAAFVGCLLGGSLSSWLLRMNTSVNFSRKVALGASAIVMPLLILVPYTTNTAWVIFLFSAGYFGQQSWSTLVMVLPTDLFPRRAVGAVAGLVGLGGALGGIALGQLASYLLDHGYSYKPVMLIAGLLHVTAFVVIMLTVWKIRPLTLKTADAGAGAAWDSLVLALKLQVPGNLVMLLGLIVVQCVMGPAHYLMMIGAAGILLAVFTVLLLLLLMMMMMRQASMRSGAVACVVLALALAAAAGKIYFLADGGRWDRDQAFASCCVAVSVLADVILGIAAAATFIEQSKPVTFPVPT